MKSLRGVLIGLALSFPLLSLWGFAVSVRPPKIVSQMTPQDLGLEYEEVALRTRDGLSLHGWFIPHKERERAKTLILMHGYPADKGDILPGFSFLSRGYNLLLFDFRYLGRSEGRYSTLGARETEDLVSAIRFLKTRGIQEVGVIGFSMGGAVALMTAPQAPEIKALVAEASYARLDLMAHELYRIPLLRYPLGFLTGLWARAFLGTRLRDVSPLEAARKIRIPVLIIHSADDETIPFSHALLLQQALAHNPRAEFWFKESSPHGGLGSDYSRRLQEFFEKNL